MTINQYTEYSHVIQGTDTKIHKEQLKAMGCKYNPNLKCGAGWIISSKKVADIQAYVTTLYDDSRPLTVAEKLNKAQGSGAIRQKEPKKAIEAHRFAPEVPSVKDDHKSKYDELKLKYETVEKLYIQLKTESELKDEVHALEVETLKAKIAKYKAKLAKYKEAEAGSAKPNEVVVEEVKPEVKKVKKVKKVEPEPVEEEEPQAPQVKQTCQHVKQDGTRCPTVPRGDKAYCGNHGRNKKE